MNHQRSIPLCIVLSIITCGIYGMYWMVVATDDVNRVTNRPGTSGGMSLVFTIITCGIYGLYWAWTMGDKLDAARETNGVGRGSFPIVFLLLNLFGLSIITMALMQNELNNYSPNF
ncbi:DUF4234 domain-containing protein [Pseudoflavonifractor sp. An85]|uniref:DUF4234 domain-containing protein n=1 Tax=Pseudoflavonifractor sp. An85 TaxID=1965661 RepID=UPI000B3A96BB|nr:DUF4234 domain-containing protein [Pseudoflavonifractor sp. An85]OUN19943.1 hypothetical protein B5G37_13280 [Pseudoflavonifractor sp. An85]